MRAIGRERLRALLRSAKTQSLYSFGMGGLPRKKGLRPVTLPKVKCLEEPAPPEKKGTR